MKAVWRTKGHVEWRDWRTRCGIKAAWRDWKMCGGLTAMKRS